MKLVHAFTEGGVSYPGYINLSVTPDGTMAVTVRGTGNYGSDIASIHLSKEQVETMYDDIATYLFPDACAEIDAEEQPE